MMTSTILRTATRYLFPLLMLFSIFLLIRGHDEPGGGFIGGLLAAMSFAMYALAYDVPTARLMLRVDPKYLVGVGLLLAGLAGVFGLVWNAPYMTTYWWHPETGPLAGQHLGTPLIFDIGVYLVVIGVTLMIVFNLAEE